MKTIDFRFDSTALTLLQSLVGENMIKYKCDPFVYSNDVYGIVGICAEHLTCSFTNSIETLDYYGTPEDVAVFRVASVPEKEIHSLVQGGTMIDMPVQNKIAEIHIINEHQKLFRRNEQTYDVMLTRGVIFKMADSLEISLEKNVWFSEMITVNRGYQLIDRFSPTNEFEENWEGEFRGECTREILSLT